MKKAQVWVETVIYTLIGITIIGILLAVSKPKIDSIRDKLVIEQTIDSLNKIYEKVGDIKIAPGNRRNIELKISKGTLSVDAKENRITWTLKSKYKYSEPGREIVIGNQKIKTTQGDPYIIELYCDFKDVDLINNGKQELKDFMEAPSPYQISIENLGIDSSGKVIIDISY